MRRVLVSLGIALCLTGVGCGSGDGGTAKQATNAACAAVKQHNDAARAAFKRGEQAQAAGDDATFERLMHEVAAEDQAALAAQTECDK